MLGFGIAVFNDVTEAYNSLDIESVGVSDYPVEDIGNLVAEVFDDGLGVRLWSLLLVFGCARFGVVLVVFR